MTDLKNQFSIAQNIASLIYIAFFSLGCSNSPQSNEPILNAITSMDNYHPDKVHEKMKQLKAIDIKDLEGEWIVLASLFSYESNDGNLGGSTFGLEGRVYKIELPSTIYVDFRENSKKGIWKYTDKNSEFTYSFLDKNLVGETFSVRVYKDTMEWISVSEDGEIYFSLVKM